MKATKPIEVIDVIDKLYKLQTKLNRLPKVDKITFRLEMESIGDLFQIAEQYDSYAHEPCEMLPYHWAIIEVGEDIQLHLSTPKKKYQIIYED